MKLTNKQKEEINFLEKWGLNQEPFTATDEEKIGYIQETVHGIKQPARMWNVPGNRLCEAKRLVDITIKMWIEDLKTGMLSLDELREDFVDSPHGLKLIDSIAKYYMTEPDEIYLRMIMDKLSKTL